MRRCAHIAVALTVLGLHGVAAAQSGEGLADQLSRPSATEPVEAEEASATETPAAPAERPWVGPQIELGYTYFKLSDGYGGGDAHAANLEVFIQLPISEIRFGIGAAMGSRDYSLAGDDLLARGTLELGFQLTELIDPLVPYLSVVGTFGALVGSRFESTVAYAVGGAGLELGASLRIYHNLHVGIAFGYQRWEMDGAGFDLFSFRIAAGL